MLGADRGKIETPSLVSLNVANLTPAPTAAWIDKTNFNVELKLQRLDLVSDSDKELTKILLADPQKPRLQDWVLTMVVKGFDDANERAFLSGQLAQRLVGGINSLEPNFESAANMIFPKYSHSDLVHNCRPWDSFTTYAWFTRGEETVLRARQFFKEVSEFLDLEDEFAEAEGEKARAPVASAGHTLEAVAAAAFGEPSQLIRIESDGGIDEYAQRHGAGTDKYEFTRINTEPLRV